MAGFLEEQGTRPAIHSVLAALVMRRPLNYFCCLTLMSVLAGCLPGGMFMPVPIPHNDRPAIRGVLLENGRPVQGEHIHVGSFPDQLSVSCEAADGGTETNYMGEFELDGDRDIFTLWWDSSFAVLAICLPREGANVFWSTSLERDLLPPFLPEQIDAVCHLDPEIGAYCRTSLADRMMADCTDDLDFEHPAGWLDATTRELFTGRCVSYHDNGQILERAEFIHGERVGPWVSFDENGLRDHQSFWIDGRLRRESVWHQNGQMFRQTHYRAAADEGGALVKHGLNTVWNEDGSIDDQQCWLDGIEHGTHPEKCYGEKYEQ